MALRLKSLNIFPRGGFRYEQPGYPQKKFTEYDGFLDQARRISRFRVANNLPRQSLEESAEDLQAAVCARAPEACTDLPAEPGSILYTLIPSAGCGTCGTPT